MSSPYKLKYSIRDLRNHDRAKNEIMEMAGDGALSGFLG